MPPHAHIHITRTSRIAVARPTTCQGAAAYAAECGTVWVKVGAPFIIQPTAVAHAWSQTETPPPPPGNMSHMAAVADAMSAP